MIVLDTNVVSELLNPVPNPRVVRWAGSGAPNSFYLTATSLTELLSGVEFLPSGKKRDLLAVEINNLIGILFQNRILPFDRVAAEALSKMRTRARAFGRPLPFGDGQMAAIAQVNGFVVATRDTLPFEAAGVAFVNPWEA
jgi:predicted nucleic acid-binding protein